MISEALIKIKTQKFGRMFVVTTFQAPDRYISLILPMGPKKGQKGPKCKLGQFGRKFVDVIPLISGLICESLKR